MDFHNILSNVKDFFSDKRHLIVIGIIGGVIIAGSVGVHQYKAYQKAQAEANIDYSPQALTVDQLQGGNYYIKDGDKFYLVTQGTMYCANDGDTAVATKADPENRMIMFGKDDESIPTLYHDTQLVFKSADFNNPSQSAENSTVAATPTDFILERFKDEGYSIGIRGLANKDDTKFRTTVSGVTYYPGSNAASVLAANAGDEMTIDKVNGVPITADNISPAGTIKGFEKGKSYSIDAYIGTSPIGGDVIADTHMMSSYEYYDLKDYSLSDQGYAIITIPDYMWSGYYYVNGAGMFRYIDGYKSHGSSNIDYNTAYYMGTDKDGNVITNAAPALKKGSDADNATDETTDATAKKDIKDTVKSPDDFVWKYSLSIDNQQKELNLILNYSDAMTYVDKNGDGKYEIITASSGATIPGAGNPAATITSPDGTVYSMTADGVKIAGTDVTDQSGIQTTADSTQTTNTDAVADTTSVTTTDTTGVTNADATATVPQTNELKADIPNPAVGTWLVSIKGMYARTFSLNSNLAGSTTDMIVKDGSDPSEMTVYVPNEMQNAIFKFKWEDTSHAGTFTINTPSGDILSNERDTSGAYKQPDCVSKEVYGEVDFKLTDAKSGEYKINVAGESLGHVYWSCVSADDTTTDDNSSTETESTETESTETEETSTETVADN